MTTLTERIPVAEVSRRARKVKFGQTVLAAITGVLFGAGWLVAKAFAVGWLGLAWAFTAVRLGWEHAQVVTAAPRLSRREQADLLAENDRLRLEVARQSGG